jgi:hypothetical protein
MLPQRPRRSRAAGSTAESGLFSFGEAHFPPAIARDTSVGCHDEIDATPAKLSNQPKAATMGEEGRRASSLNATTLPFDRRIGNRFPRIPALVGEPTMF